MNQKIKRIVLMGWTVVLTGCFSPAFQQIPEPVAQNSKRIAFFDFENGIDPALKINPALAVLTSNSTEVISGKYSLKLDTMADGKGVKDFLNTVASRIPLKGGKRYELDFNYRILGLGKNSHLYYAALTAKGQVIHPWQRYFREQLGNPGFFRRKIVFPPNEAGGTLCIGVNNKATMIIDNIEIRQLQDFDLDAAGVAVADSDYEPYGVCTHFAWVRGMPVADHPNWYAAPGSEKKKTTAWGVNEEVGDKDKAVKIDIGYTDDQVVEGIRLIKDAGFQWFRVDGSWADMEPEQGVYNASKLNRLDMVLNEAKKNGLNTYILLFSTPRWVSEKPDDADFWAYAPRDLQSWRNYVRFIAERYKGRVTYWEIGNEIDWVFWRSSPKQFAEYLKAAYETLKTVDPCNQVIMSGLAFDGTYVYRYRPGAEENALQKLYDAGIKNYSDILAIHPYAHSWYNQTVKSLDAINNFYSIMKANGDGDKPIWITEMGESTVTLKNLAKKELGHSITDEEAEQAQADYCKKVYTELIKHPKIDKIFWYNLRDQQCEYEVANAYGLLRMDMTPLPAYDMFKNLPKSNVRKVNSQFLEN